jgi:hypothetical protein
MFQEQPKAKKSLSEKLSRTWDKLAASKSRWDLPRAARTVVFLENLFISYIDCLYVNSKIYFVKEQKSIILKIGPANNLLYFNELCCI